GVALGDQGAVGVGTHARGTHDDAAHRLHAAGDHDVVGAGHDALGGEVDRLLAGAALAVDGRGRDVGGEAGAEPGHAAGGRRLLAHLRHAADDDVVHGPRVQVVARDQLAEGLGEQVHRVDVGEGSALTSATGGGAHRVDDDHIVGSRFCHTYFLS